ncbi:right-handed parallel beta-helix repeat-containing protein, partial [Streptomyces tricolor]
THTNFCVSRGPSCFTQTTPPARCAARPKPQTPAPPPPGSNQFWTGANGSRCPSYAGALGWSFASDGRLVVTFGGSVVNP